jgi:hypothetical protein
MTVGQWERRFACALGMSIWLYLTHGYGGWALGVIIGCMLYASIPDIIRRFNRRR